MFFTRIKIVFTADSSTAELLPNIQFYLGSLSEMRKIFNPSKHRILRTSVVLYRQKLLGKQKRASEKIQQSARVRNHRSRGDLIHHRRDFADIHDRFQRHRA